MGRKLGAWFRVAQIHTLPGDIYSNPILTLYHSRDVMTVAVEKGFAHKWMKTLM
jgi:hypothetical protein